ncbi:hypothetical protein [Halorhabdus rudnickae]|uniref:hypothetical protein n=1 Tax=Halorhabdus rudnickae TaxID=1775544 RepID=UPI001AF01776|nr:hypothetical protein [Halorhabdus rudnickae]
MGKRPTPAYITGTIFAAVLSVVGVYLPWVQKQPVGYTDGQPYYTAEFVAGLEAGFDGGDPFIILLVVAVVVVVILARYRTWSPDIALIGVGAVTFLLFGNTFLDYWSVERYAVQPGLFLLVISGLIFIFVGAGAILKREFSTHI